MDRERFNWMSRKCAWALGVLLPVLVVGGLAWWQYRARSDRLGCLGNMLQVRLAVELYADDHGGYAPSADGLWPWRILPAADGAPRRRRLPKAFKCPRHQGVPGYGINGRLGEPKVLAEIADPDATVFVAESDRVIITELDNVAFDRHQGLANVLFADMHVESLPLEKLNEKQFDVRIVAPR